LEFHPLVGAENFEVEVEAGGFGEGGHGEKGWEDWWEEVRGR